MLVSIKGKYENGQVILEEKPPVETPSEVVVTFTKPLKTDGKPMDERTIGFFKGSFVIPDDFDEPLDDLKEYME